MEFREGVKSIYLPDGTKVVGPIDIKDVTKAYLELTKKPNVIDWKLTRTDLTSKTIGLVGNK